MSEVGIEPTTPGLWVLCSTNWATPTKNKQFCFLSMAIPQTFEEWQCFGSAKPSHAPPTENKLSKLLCFLSMASPRNLPWRRCFAVQNCRIYHWLKALRLEDMSWRHVTCRIVAGPGIEPGSQGYEPCEIPLLYPAIYINFTKTPLYSTYSS